MPQYSYDDPSALLKKLRSDMEQWSIPPDPRTGVADENVFFKSSDDHDLRALVFKAAGKTSEPCPLVVFFHGGGFTTGRPEDTAVSCRKIVQTFGAVCVAPSYRLAPENSFPVGVNDAWDALKWIAANATSLGASPEAGFLLGGVSSGGNFTSVLSHRARDEDLQPPLTGLILQAPSLLPPSTVPEKYRDRYLSRSQPECVDSFLPSAQLRKICYDSTMPDDHSPLYAPFNWPTGHNNLPPHYFQVCGTDVNRDEALIFESVLREENNVNTRIDVYPGQPHVFWSVFPQLEATKKFAVDFVNGVGWLLEKEIPCPA